MNRMMMSMNPMMMNNPMMNNPMMNDLMMNDPMMMNMNIIQNMSMNMVSGMGNMISMNVQNLNKNNLMRNNLNEFEVDEVNRPNRLNNNNCKTVKLFYEEEFIQNVDINSNDDYDSIIEKFKSILFKAGKVIYRKAFPYEVIERKSADETLEYLLDRGVIEKNPRVVISNNTHPIKFECESHYNFSFIKNGDSLQVELEGKTYGASSGLSCLEFIDIDKSTKPKKLPVSSKAPKWRNAVQGLNLFGKCINKECKAYKEEVVHTVGINRKFDFNSDRKKIKCPICSKNFIPITMGFWKCEYQIKG